MPPRERFGTLFCALVVVGFGDEALLSEARRVAARRRVTLRTLVEEGLRQVVKAERGKPRFTLRDASFGGTGLGPEFADGNWERIRDAAYSGRGA